MKVSKASVIFLALTAMLLGLMVPATALGSTADPGEAYDTTAGDENAGQCEGQAGARKWDAPSNDFDREVVFEGETFNVKVDDRSITFSGAGLSSVSFCVKAGNDNSGPQAGLSYTANQGISNFVIYGVTVDGAPTPDCSLNEREGGQSPLDYLLQNQLDCISVDVVAECNSVTGTITVDSKVLNSSAYTLKWVEDTEVNAGNIGTAQALPASFDENSGTRSVTVYVDGPEQDYVLASSASDFAFPNGGVDYEVPTDCDPVTDVELDPEFTLTGPSCIADGSLTLDDEDNFTWTVRRTDGEGGSVDLGDGTFGPGEYTLEATADEGYFFTDGEDGRTDSLTFEGITVGSQLTGAACQEDEIITTPDPEIGVAGSASEMSFDPNVACETVDTYSADITFTNDGNADGDASVTVGTDVSTVEVGADSTESVLVEGVPAGDLIVVKVEGFDESFVNDDDVDYEACETAVDSEVEEVEVEESVVVAPEIEVLGVDETRTVPTRIDSGTGGLLDNSGLLLGLLAGGLALSATGITATARRRRR